MNQAAVEYFIKTRAYEVARYSVKTAYTPLPDLTVEAMQKDLGFLHDDKSAQGLYISSMIACFAIYESSIPDQVRAAIRQHDAGFKD